MFTKGAIVAAAALSVTAVTAASVYAQSPEPPEVRRPYRGIFGGPSDPNSPHSLTLTGSLYAAYDDNVLEAITRESIGRRFFDDSGTYQGANVGLNYTFALDGERADFTGHANGQYQYYRTDDRSGGYPAAQADAAFNYKVTRSLAFNARQSVAYTSTYSSALFPVLDEDAGHDISAPVDFNFALFEMRGVRSTSRVGLSQEIGRYASASASYYLRNHKLLDSELPDSEFDSYSSQSASAAFLYARPMTRYATMRIGYGIRWYDGRRNTGEPDVMHNINVGVDYGRALSFSRRTSFSFGTGSAITVSEPLAGQNAGGQPRTRAFLIGNAALIHELGRTWTASVAYSRGLRTREGFHELYLTDAVTASIGGLVTRRLQFSAAASWANSTTGYDSSRGHRGMQASAQATYGLNSFLGLYAQYIYYRYRYDEDVLLDPRFPRQLDRQGVRVGLTTSVPLIR